jgi:UDP-glucose 4-epimerase
MTSTVLSESSSTASSPRITGPSTPDTERDVLFDDHPLRTDAEEYILVTGGCGFIGSHTSLELLKAGYNVIIVDNLSNSFRDVFDRVLLVANRHFDAVGGQCPRAKLYDTDYRDTSAMKALLAAHSSVAQTGTIRSNITGVIHFAAYKAVEESIRNPMKYYRNNISGLIDLLTLLDEHDIKIFIFSSSATVYGTLADSGLPLREEHCVHQNHTYQDFDGTERHTEQGCTGLTNPYGRTKFFGEAILADLANSDLSWTITALRYFNPIGCDPSGLLGEDPKGTPSNLVPVVVKVMTGQWKELSIFGSDWDTADGTAIRDFIHVSDLAKGHIAALAAAEREHSEGGRMQAGLRTFNLGTGSGHSVAEIVDTMESVSQRPVPRKLVGRRPGDVGSCVAVADRAAQELGWKAEKSLRNACEDICNFLRVSEW